jgi:hypothetical protein
VRVFKSFTSAMTMAYPKESINKANTLSRRVDFKTQVSLTLFRDGDESHSFNPLFQYKLPISQDAPLASKNSNARLHK